MINKYQQGGTSQQGSVLLLIQQLPEDLQEQIMQAFAKWALQKGVNIQLLKNNPQALEAALGLFIQEVRQQQGQQTVAARHGAKLNYLKSLKNQCPEGQELYYYKKGGMVKCGCSGKKLQDGGEVKKESAVTKFKKQRSEGTFGRAIGKVAKVATNSAKKAIDKAKEEHRKELEWKVSGKNTSTSSDYAEYDKCGSKIKKHNNGGSLNGIPFYQWGTNKGGINSWKFSERNVGNLGNGYSVTNHWIYQDMVNGLNLGDFPPTVAGRTIYTSPYRSDTLYWRNLDPDQWYLGEKVPTKSKNQVEAKQNFYKWIKKAKPESGFSESSYKRAKQGK